MSNSKSSGHFRTFRTFPDASGHAPDGFRTNSGQVPDSGRVLAQEVLAFIESDTAPFETKDVYSELCAKDRREKRTISDALSYYEKKNKIKKIDGKRGGWQVVENEPEVMDLLAADTCQFNILFPLGISDQARVRPGSIILVSGSNNAGKTLFLLTVVRNFFSPHTYPQILNTLSNKLERKGVAPIVYLNSEMSAGELVTRIRGFGDEPSSWQPHVSFIERSHSFDKLVRPDGITVIDFLEVNEDFFQAGKLLADIHRQLSSGIAVVAMQKKQGHDFAKGGEMTLEKPRLVINLDKNETHGFICKIIKCKEPVDFMHPIQGKERDFVISNRSEIIPISDWRFVNEKQRRAINNDYEKTDLPNRVKRDRLDYKTGDSLDMSPVLEEGII